MRGTDISEGYTNEGGYAPKGGGGTRDPMLKAHLILL